MKKLQSTKANDVDSGYRRLENQIAWYDEKSVLNQRRFKRLKSVELVTAASIPVLASHEPVITAILGATLVVIAGLQHLNQYQPNWIAYRTTCEALRHEKYLFVERAGHYASIGDDDARKSLACRVESLVSTEHAKWVLAQHEARRNKKEGAT